MSRAPLLATLISLALAAPAGAATTIVPDTFDDQVPADCSPAHAAGTCSVREAVAEAQDGDTIQLAEGTYALALDQLLVGDDVTFTGAGPSATIIEQHAIGKRVIEFDSGTTASMSGLTVTGGNVIGGDGPDGTTVTPIGGAGIGAYGGGIHAGGTALMLTLVNVIGNSVTGGAGGDGFSPAAGAGGAGGAGGYADDSGIYAPQHLTLDRVTVADNVAHGSAGGHGGAGTGSNDGGAGGSGGSGGGGVGGGPSMVLIVRDSTISGNKGFAGSGGNGGNGGANAGGDGGDGGRSVRGTGGGIFSNGNISVVNSTIVGNEIHGGNGGDGGASALSTGGDGGNAEPGDGGGISLYNNASPGIHGHIASSTIASNVVTVAIGGKGGNGIVDGADDPPNPANGGNISVYGDTLEIRDSVIAGGVGSPAHSNCVILSSTVTSHDHNVDSTNQCIPAPDSGDRHDLDPMLGPLQDNGGPTKTMAPLSASPVINGGPAICQGVGTALTTDQRGAARDAVCDNGAYEAVAPGAGIAPSVGGSPVAGQTLTCVNGSFSGDAPQTIDTVWLRDGQQTTAGVTYPIPPADVGHALACRQTATNAYGSASADSTAVQVTAAPAGASPGAKPKLSNLKIKPKKLHRRTKAKVTFTLSEAARVTFKICRFKGKKCTRVKKGAPKALQGKKGINLVRLKAKGLKRGRYRLTATPAGGKGVRASFRVAQ